MTDQQGTRVASFAARAKQLVVDRVTAGIPPVDQAVAVMVATESFELLLAAYEGGAMYVPKDAEHQHMKRNDEIFEKFGRVSLHDLVELFKLTAVRLYQIYTEVRVQRQREYQSPLPGFEDPAGNAHRVRAFITHAVAIITGQLLKARAVPVQEAKRAQAVARECAHAICVAYGGVLLYVPKVRGAAPINDSQGQLPGLDA